MEWAFPKNAAESEKTDAQKEAEKAAFEDSKRRVIYSRIFGNEPVNRSPEFIQEKEPESNPLFRGVGSALRRRQ
jgi:hypothetical protein